MKILDTSFLIDLQREWARGITGPARQYLEREAGEEYAISTLSVLEFLEGYRQPGDGERFLDPFPQLEVNTNVARIGSRIRRNLRDRGGPIGDFDVLIAATALAAGLPLVTDNLSHFQRVEGLVLDRYQ
jgi:predicted nucleic acid-binding protein